MATALSALEVAALVDLDEGKIRKDVEHGIFDKPRFSRGDLVYFRLLATIGSIATASQAYLRIMVGVGLSVLLLGEQLQPTHWIGLALVIAGVVAMTLRRRLA